MSDPICRCCRLPMMPTLGGALFAGLLVFGIDLLVNNSSAGTVIGADLARHVLATGLCMSCSLRTFQPARLPQDRPEPVRPVVPAPRRKRALGGRPKRPVGAPK